MFFSEEKNQKTLVSAARLVLAVGAWAASMHLARGQAAPDLSDNGKPYLEVPAAPQKGFNYPYILFTPPQPPSQCPLHIIAEPNNGSGIAPDNPQLKEARDAAVRVATHASLGNEMAQRFGFPLLVPIFPRPAAGHDSDIDFYSLSRAALFAGGKLKRVDLQLLAMAADAQTRLRAEGTTVDRKILMTGVSGSGLFSSRFVFLHPDMVQAAAFGALNSFVTIPVAAIKGHKLEYPLGLADYASITGHAFDKAAYNAVPQLAFQGENDDNDAIGNDDEYTPKERDLIWSLFGEPMFPDRWEAVQAAYQAAGSTVVFKTYSKIGHGFDQRALHDIATTFSKALSQGITCRY
jgi:hypothetical protein